MISSQLPGGGSAAGRVGPKHQTKLALPVWFSRGGVVGVLSHQGGELVQAPSSWCPGLPLPPACTIWDRLDTHHLKAVAHACEARTGFDRLSSNSFGLGWLSCYGRSSSGGRPFFVGSYHRSTHENGCATMGLHRVKSRCTLDVVNCAGREDHSVEVLNHYGR